MFHMKKFTIVLLGTVFVALITCSIQSVYADHLEPGQGLFSSEEGIELVTTEGTKYKVHLQSVIRTGDDQLISVAEETMAGYIPNEITDYVFDTLMGEKEIVIIDNIKYEKVRYTFSPTLEQRWMGMYQISEEVKINIEVEGDALVQMNKKIKNYSVWKIHYCADFADIGHTDGIQCIPIFQVLVPTMTLEPTDVITNHWTVLRELN